MKKGILKSNKLVKVVLGTSLALAIATIGAFQTIDYTSDNTYDQIETSIVNEQQGIKLSSASYSKKLAENLGVSEFLAKDDAGNFIRFEAIEGKPIDVIVDENSVWSMIDSVQEGIKKSIAQYNEMFSMINPNYQLRYISKEEYDKNPTSNPFIYITTNLSLNTVGGAARAVTSPAEAETSIYGNGSVDSHATIIISSTGTVSLSVNEIQNVVSHEIAHALGLEAHSDNPESIMYTTSSGITSSSNYFSQDLLYSMLALYYNNSTNPHSSKDIKAYIDNQVINRTKEMEEYKKQAEQTTAQQNPIEVEQQVHHEVEQQNQIDSINLYLKNLKNYAKSSNEKLGNVKEAINNCYTHTNVYGQTISFTFSNDFKYNIEVYDDSRTINCTGRYKIENNLIICDGQFFTVENGKYTNTNDQIYFSILSSGECVYGTKSNNSIISGSLEKVEEKGFSLN